MLNSARCDQPIAPIFAQFGSKSVTHLLSSCHVYDDDLSMDRAADYYFPEIDVREDDNFYLFTADVLGME